MSDPTTPVAIGPFLACGVADGYGAGFEFTTAPYVKKHNRMETYIPHPKFTQRPANCYTDDTQMALGLAEHLLEGAPLIAQNLADRWVRGFHRDARTGYSQGFYDILMKTQSGSELLATVLPHSTKNGGAMRAFPIGFLSDAAQVRDLAMWQASLTHATWRGMTAAAAAALMFHHRYHRLGTKLELVHFLQTWLPGTDWTSPANTTSLKTGTDGLDTVRASLHCLVEGKSLTDVIQMAVALQGDTDTVAAIAAASAAVCSETRNALPDSLVNGLENGTYGRDYLRSVDEKLRAKFPPRWLIQEGPKPTKTPRVIKRVPVVVPPKAEGEGPLDFLFDED